MKGFIGLQTALIATIIFLLGSISAALLTISGSLQKPEISLGAVSGNIAPKQSSTSVFALGTTARNLTATSSAGLDGCAARQISTGTSSIRMIFSGITGQDRRPTDSQGLFQAASTTVNYGAEDYGCGNIWGISNTGVSTVTITESY